MTWERTPNMRLVTAFLIAIALATPICAKAAAASDRVALVIGNSHYLQLGPLSNPASDGKAVADALQKMGYSTTLVLDANEETLRRSVRQFARDSEAASIAVVFFAGHGAQVAGENYLLPIDTEVPREEADIELTGLKVDDLVNGIQSTNKIIFLDACRDNPSLFKNIVSGRGLPALGLAPVNTSSVQAPKEGGGVFIAYATDSGSVALDGTGEHSPFTQALLQHVTEPISIDDMFSAVTRDVREATKGAQRPYKYASLENVICLPARCAPNPASAAQTPELDQTTAIPETLTSPLEGNSLAALSAFLASHPTTERRNEIESAIAAINRRGFDEWTLIDFDAKSNQPIYLKIGSITEIGTRTEYAVRYPGGLDPSKDYPKGTYTQQLIVADCGAQQVGVLEGSLFAPSGDLLSHDKFGDPAFIDLPIKVSPGTHNAVQLKFVCDERMRTPLIAKGNISLNDFTVLASSTTLGDVLYKPLISDTNGGMKDAVIVTRPNEPKKLNELPGLQRAPDDLRWNYLASITRFKCDLPQEVELKDEFYDSRGDLIELNASDAIKWVWQPIPPKSNFDQIRQIVCNDQRVQK